MTKFEKAIIDFFVKRKEIVFLVIICLAGLFVRWSGFDVLTNDMKSYLLPWYDQIKDGGFHSLSYQIGDYNILYQTIIFVLSKINVFNIDAKYLYKGISVIGDYFFAFAAARLLCALTEKPLFKSTFNVAFAVVLFLPTVVVNSAFWGQCDSIYSAFVLATVYCAYKEKWVRMAVMFGLAFAFKLQAVFILPFLILYYFYSKKYSIFHYVISLAVFWLTGIVAFIAGRPLKDPLMIYFGQTQEYPLMYASIPSFWMLLNSDYTFSVLALGIVFVLMGIMVYLCVSGRFDLESAEGWIGLACWCVWACILFLPAMHDRYTYLVDILLVILAFINVKYVKFAVVSVALSLHSYSTYLSRASTLEADVIPVLTPWHAALYIAAFAWFTYILFKQIIVKNEPQQPTE